MKARAGWGFALVAMLVAMLAAGAGWVGTTRAFAAPAVIGAARTVSLTAPRKVRMSSAVNRGGGGGAGTVPFLPRSKSDYANAKHASSTGANAGRRTGIVTGHAPQAAARAASSAVLSAGAFPITSLPEQVGWFGQDQSVEPPDTQLAVGDGYLTEAVNSTLSVWTESGAVVEKIDLNSFFDVSAFASGAYFTDPRLLFDVASQRWYLSGWAANTSANSGRVYLAVSASSDPTGSWNIYTLVTESGTITDQPTLGIASDKVVLAWNDFDAQGNFTGAEVDVVQESSLVAGSTAQSYDVNTGTGHFSIVPAQSLTATATEWMAFDDTDGGAIGVISVTGTPDAGNVTLTPTTFSGVTTTVPPAAQQAGGSNTISTDDDRFESATWQNGDLWTAGNDACSAGQSGTDSCLRVIEAAAPESGGPSLAQNFDLSIAGYDLYYPAITMDGAGDLDLSYTLSSPLLYAGVYVSEQEAGSPNSFQSTVIQAGQGYYPGSRWGDYSAAAPDPSNPSHIWVAGEYSLSSDQGWGTATEDVEMAPLITGVSPSSGAFSGGTSVTISGRDFDPGAKVTFGTGAATSVTVSSTTQITAVSPPGYGTVGVTVTNPDGTSMTSDNAFTYNAAPYVSYFTWFDRVSSPGFRADDIHVVNPTSSTADVVVNIPGRPGCVDSGTIAAGGEQVFSCANGFGGPVTVNADQPVLASQRVEYYQSFNEVLAQSASQAQDQLYFTWYDRVSSPGFQADNVHVIDPGGSTADVSVSIPGCSAQSGTISPGGEQIFSCATGFGGPVTVTSTDNVPVLASQRVEYYQSFNEVLAQSASQAQDQLNFTWFDRVSSPGFKADNVHVIDPGSSPAQVSVNIPGCKAQTGTITPGGEQIFSCASGFGGPVTVNSTNNVPVLASQRVEFYQTFNEVTAQPASGAGKTLYFTWFDRISSPGFKADNVHIINPGTATADVSVTIPGCKVQTGTVQPGSEQIFTCASGFGGPVVVSSDQAVLASQRVEFYQSFNEVTAMSASTAP